MAINDCAELPRLGSRTGLCALLVALATAVVAVLHRQSIGAATITLSSSDSAWLALAGLGTIALWAAGTASQIGTVPVRLPLGRLFAVQIAASFANHLAPGGIGGAFVNLRFLRRHGVAPGVGVASLGLNAAAGAIGHVLLLAFFVAFVPGTVPALTAAVSLHLLVWAAAAAVAVATVGLITARVARPWWASLGRRGAELCREVRRNLADLRGVLTDRRRAAALWTGAIATPLCHALVLYAVTRALAIPVGAALVGAVYLTVSGVSALTPGPGGFGAFDVLLAAGLTAVGVPASAAVAATVAYRLVTVWLPLVPAGCLLAVLVRRKVI